MAEKIILISREQDHEFRSYDDIEEVIPEGRNVTIRDIRRKFADRLNLTGEMICLINGTPKSEDHVLQDGDRAFFKGATKARGIVIRVA